MISSLLLGFSSLAAAQTDKPTTYHLKWSHKLPIDTSLYEGAISLGNRVSETGELKDISQFPIANTLAENKIQMPAGEYRILILAVKNKSKKSLKFAVAPHNVLPVEASLGIKFNCLCNGHTYTVAPGGSWYRIMRLDTLKSAEVFKKEVVMEHHIFAVK